MLKLVCLSFILMVFEVSGHGMMLDPPNRSSVWRFDEEAPINYNDNQNFCGGFDAQWNKNGGKCGVCGDDFSAPHPQDNENTGVYGQGKVVETYKSGQIVNTSILITANHLGHFEYHLCVLTDPSNVESGEDCFQPLKFEDGTFEFPLDEEAYEVYNSIQLPEGLTCERCVLRWHYRSGNNWNPCESGEILPGCGAQETFRSCADISIV